MKKEIKTKVILTFILMSIIQGTSAQQAGQSFDLESIPVKVSEFRVKNVENKNYLHWVAQNDNVSGLFMLERSENSGNFYPVMAKEMVPAKYKIKVFYCWTDESANEAEVYNYRLMVMDENGSSHYIEPEEVKKDLQSSSDLRVN